jgi:hypothetical protein
VSVCVDPPYDPPDPPFPFRELDARADNWVWQVTVATRLGHTPEAFLALLDGDPVPVDYMDHEWWEWFRRVGVVP